MKEWQKRIKISLSLLSLFACPLMLSAYEEQTLQEEIITTEITEAGTYPVIVRYRDGNGVIQSEETYYITITYPRTTVSEKKGEAIDAYDITLSEELLDKITDEELIKLANARAWRTDNGYPIQIEKVDKTFGKEKGTITFTTANGTTTTTNVLIIKGNIKQPISINRMYVDFQTIPSYITILLVILLLILSPLLLFGINFYLVKKEQKEIASLLYDEK